MFAAYSSVLIDRKVLSTNVMNPTPFLFNGSEKKESLEFLVELLEQLGTQQKLTILIQLNSEHNLRI